MQQQETVVRSRWDRNFVVSLLSGACAGLSVDLLIFPLDTLKTRLQSEVGLKNSGGLKNLYAGSGPVVLGSAPGSAAFFVTYDLTKRLLETQTSLDPLAHMCAAINGEIIACLIRVPVEVVKQRTQVSRGSSWLTFRNTLKYEGMRGLFRGYGSTVSREIPFSLIQFPLWELLKKDLREDYQRDLTPIETAVCGGMAGAFAGAVTTPLDVVKTRIILHKEAKLTMRRAFAEIYRQKGVEGLIAGMGPRTSSLAIGGFIFLGVYEKAKQLLEARI